MVGSLVGNFVGTAIVGGGVGCFVGGGVGNLVGLVVGAGVGAALKHDGAQLLRDVLSMAPRHVAIALISDAACKQVLAADEVP